MASKILQGKKKASRKLVEESAAQGRSLVISVDGEVKDVLFAQDTLSATIAEKPGLYSLNIFAGGGASYYLSESGKPSGITSEVSRLHAAGTFRIMWYPDHLLRIGLETGITDFYS